MIDRLIEVTRIQPIEDRIVILLLAVTIALVSWLSVAIIGSAIQSILRKRI